MGNQHSWHRNCSYIDRDTNKEKWLQWVETQKHKEEVGHQKTGDIKSTIKCVKQDSMLMRKDQRE